MKINSVVVENILQLKTKMSSSPCGSDMVGHSSSSGGRQRSRRVAAGLARLVDHVGVGHGHVGETAALISNITRDGPGARTSLQG